MDAINIPGHCASCPSNSACGLCANIPEHLHWMIEAHNRRVEAILAGSEPRRGRPPSGFDASQDSRAIETERLVRYLRKAELDRERAESCQLEARNDGGVQ